MKTHKDAWNRNRMNKKSTDFQNVSIGCVRSVSIDDHGFSLYEAVNCYQNLISDTLREVGVSAGGLMTVWLWIFSVEIFCL